MMPNRKIILCVDDDPIMLLSQEVLLGNDFDIVTAGSGQRGLDALGSNIPDLVLVDYNMPDLNAVEFIRAGNYIRPGLKYVLLSGTPYDKIDWESLYPLGVIGFLQKPFEPSEIKALLAA
jgi:response regulator RpfG family c-di-GMP phosphodiesterase